MAIILPTDSPAEGLRKQLLQRITPKDPRVALFEEYRAAGLDSETSSALSDLGTMDTAAQAQAILSQATIQQGVAVQQTVVTEVPTALRNIGASAGAAIGSTVGLTVLKMAVRHSSFLLITSFTVAGIVGTYAATRFVSGSLGKLLGAVAGANVAAAAGLLTVALLKGPRQ